MLSSISRTCMNRATEGVRFCRVSGDTLGILKDIVVCPLQI